MRIAPDAPRRPALRYYGGKWNLAEWIISFFPPHLNCVEPCGGAASVLLQKPRSPLETYNDLDGNVVNFFRVLRDSPNELIRKLELTPWARTEFTVGWRQTRHTDPVEWARRFAVFSWMALFPAIAHDSPGCRMRKTGDYKGCSDVNEKYSGILEPIAKRLLGVQIENIDYKKAIIEYDNPNALIYFDPPYIADTRDIGNLDGRTCYAFEMDDNQHAEAAMQLHRCSGYVIVSGYACPLYADIYERHGWQRHDKEAQTNNGGKRVESVWLSPRTVDALTAPKQASMFA